MALSEVQLAHIHKLFSEYCDGKVPPALRDKVRVGYRVSGHAVELFESHPGIFKRKEWIDHGVAKFRFLATRGRWRLLCQYRDLRWHRYERVPEAATIGELLREVDRDPTCIFWG